METADEKKNPIAHSQLNDYHDNNPPLGAILKSSSAQIRVEIRGCFPEAIK
jgi:hypothetical protein